MKIPLTYGLTMALGGIAVSLLLYFAGLHDSAEKMQTAQWIQGGIGFLLTVVFLCLAMRERRATSSPANDWGYGSAFGVGALTVVFAVVISTVWTYVYLAMINPSVSDITLQMQMTAMEAKGVPPAQVAQMEPMLRKWMSPPAMTAINSLFGLVFGIALTAIVAIFFRQRDVPPLADAPPTLG